MTKLINGLIPAFTECPFKAECETLKRNKCNHKDKEHPVAFSCATARMFQRLDDIPSSER